MANSTSAANPELWSAILEKALRKSTLFREVASFKEQAGLKYGDVVHRPYISTLSVDSYVPGTGSTAQAITVTDNSMTIDRYAIINVYIDDIEALQSKYDLAAAYMEQCTKLLAEDQDAHFLLEIRNAVADVDNGDIAGGTAGDPFAVTSDNVLSVFTYANKYLRAQNAEGEKFAIVTPGFLQKLETYLGGKYTQLGDEMSKFGYKPAMMFQGFKVYTSNSLPTSSTWTPADNPANGATITIDSVVFTFVNSMGTTAGSVLQTTNTATTLLALQALINAGGVGDGTKHYSVSAANKRKVRNWYATVDNATTPTNITVYVGGKSAAVAFATSEVLDTWSTNDTINQFFGVVGCTDMVVQKEVNVKKGDGAANGLLGATYLPNTVYKAKTFYEGTYKMVNVKVTEASAA